MKTQISLSEVESLIRKNIQEKGLHNHISNDQIEEIKKKIKARLSMPSAGVMFYSSPDVDGGAESGLEEAIAPTEEDQDDVISVQKTNNPISHETTIDNNALDVSKKEGELETKEQINLLFLKQQ